VGASVVGGNPAARCAPTPSTRTRRMPSENTEPAVSHFTPVGAGGDPFLFELYRRFGRADTLPTVQVVNRVGGVQHPGAAYREPRYRRHCAEQAEVLRALDEAASAVQRATGWRRLVAVDVAVPSYRADPLMLEGILGCRHVATSLHVPQ
jgi:hypothetical protein